MGLKKKKNIIILTVLVIVCFTIYQLYFFLTISSESITHNKILHEINNSKDIILLRSEADKNIDDNGVIRGVLYGSILRYRPDTNNKFKCLKTEQRIPFEYVNDDYCDCEDGTDEPSTTACVNGIFYCEQYKRKPVSFKSFNSIPSSKVNDGICDCCDGSDEWLHGPNDRLLTLNRHYTNKCPNVCSIK